MAYIPECTPCLQSGRRVARHKQTFCPKGRYGVKYAKDLASERVMEKFEVERVYWSSRGVDWGVVTEHEIDAEADRCDPERPAVAGEQARNRHQQDHGHIGP